MSPRDDELKRLFGGEGLRRAFERVRQRVEQGGFEGARGVTLKGLSDVERDALAGLLGLVTVQEERLFLRIEELDRACRESRASASLEEVLTALGGPLANRRAERDARRRLRADGFARARAHPTIRARPVLEEWLDELSATGLAARAAQRYGGDLERVLHIALDVVSALPADGVLLPVLAARATGDAHALDAGRLLSSIVLRAARRMVGWPEPPANADQRRRLWSLVGVECDALSPTVLSLGLSPTHGDDPLSSRLRRAREQGEPARVMLWELERHGAPKVGHARVFVVENPVVIASAAALLGGASPPLVCVEGVPTTAAVRWLGSLREQGVELRFHCDFDWGGVRIGNLLHERFGAQPWRMTTADYTTAHEGIDEAMALAGEPVEAAWDGELAEAMRRRGVAVYEEQVLDELLRDLRRGMGGA